MESKRSEALNADRAHCAAAIVVAIAAERSTRCSSSRYLCRHRDLRGIVRERERSQAQHQQANEHTLE